MKKANLIMLGAPGSGKGTRAVALCEALGIIQIATGDLFRSNLKEGTRLGRLAKSYMDKGELVPDDVTAEMVKERLSDEDAQKGFVLDGFPRTIKQAEMLEKLLVESDIKIAAVLYLEADDEVIVKRLAGRLICEKCQAPYHKDLYPPKVEGICDKCGGKLYSRDDDNPATVRKRLAVYRSTTFPLVEYYQKKGLLVKLPQDISPYGVVEDMRNLAKRLDIASCAYSS